MKFIDRNRRYQLYRGDKLIGIVTVVGSDQPYFCGQIEPAEGYSEVARLFSELAENRRQRSSPDVSGVSEERRALRNMLARRHSEIVQALVEPGLKMVDAKTGQLIFEPMEMEVDERGWWFRGRLWQEDGTTLLC